MFKLLAPPKRAIIFFHGEFYGKFGVASIKAQQSAFNTPRRRRRPLCRKCYLQRR